MRVTLCDGCGKTLSNKRDKVFEPWDVVPLGSGEKADLCKACYPYYEALRQRKEEFAANRIRELREVEERMTQEFWEGVRKQHGPETKPEANAAS